MRKRFQQLLEGLQTWDESVLTSKWVSLLSSMGLDEQRALREAWPHIPLDGRRVLTQNLREMAEADVLVNFTDVFLVALDDPDEQVRLAALMGLWEYEEEDFVPTLIRMMESDPSVAVRAEAAMQLGRFAMAGELGEMDSETMDVVQRALMAAWNSPDQDLEVRRRALEAVSCVTNDAIPGMIEAAYRDKDERMNVSAVFAMGQTLDDAWAPYVLKELKSPRPEMRYEAARAAGELRLEDAVPTLLDMLNDPDIDVRVGVIEALGLIGGERALQVLMELARNENEAIREAALEALEVVQFGEDPLSPAVLTWILGKDLGEMEDWDEELEEDEGEDEGDEEEWEHDWDRDRWN
ncbi:MAG: HEAT repeat domain-containing protein [Anaerolineae bacterium]|nr:HEAT repeat domain-containing protein [Anaerolineae bacterium]